MIREAGYCERDRGVKCCGLLLLVARMIKSDGVNSTSLDFFFWGWLKDEIYRDGPISTIPELKAKIVNCCRTVPEEFLIRACRSVKKRCQKVVQVYGGNFL